MKRKPTMRASLFTTKEEISMIEEEIVYIDHV